MLMQSIKIDVHMDEASMTSSKQRRWIVEMTAGLEGVVVAETVLSDVDGEAGRLIIRGRSLDELAQATRFEDIAQSLFDGLFPDMPRGAAGVRALGAARCDAFRVLAGADAAVFALPPVQAVRALLARLPDADDAATALRLVAAPAVFTAAVRRRRQGLRPIPPDAAIDHARDALRMAGLEDSAASAAALTRYLVTVVDHGLNASTFAARVVASTRAGLVSAAIAGLSALQGPLHGGAPGPVLDMLDAIGRPEDAEAWLDAAVERGDRLMGFGHRIYRVRDPRADALEAALQQLRTAGRVREDRWRLAQATELAALAVLRRRKPGRPLATNVEFYTALLLDALGFERELFTCVFAMGRIAGWLAHAREQVLTGRLMRPQSRYVGPALDVSIDEI
jgi:citrate synthase